METAGAFLSVRSDKAKADECAIGNLSIAGYCGNIYSVSGSSVYSNLPGRNDKSRFTCMAHGV